MNNPLLTSWNTPHKLPPFEIIKAIHFKPAVELAINEAKSEIDNICNNTDLPDFNNTIEALERIGEKLDNISSVLFNLNSAETNKDLQEAARDVSPLLSAFSNDINLNRSLFKRVETVYSQYNSLNLPVEEKMLLKKQYRGFIRGGAGLDESKRDRFREISKELSTLTLKFGENVLEETNAYELHITNKDDLAGIPDSILEAAGEEARNRKKEGWVFTLHYPSYIPFMQYADNRKLREKVLKAYSSRAYNSKSNDNKEIVRRIINLRLEKAIMLGYNNHAEYTLEDRMLNSPDKVSSFLNDLFLSSHKFAKKDYKDLSDFAKNSGATLPVEKWDWAYYSESLKKKKYDISDEILKPYFKLEDVEKAIFSLAGKLFGLSFNERNDLPKYHPEVKTFEVYDINKELISVFLVDYHPRKGKSGGAWMTAYREQSVQNKQNIRPIISIVTNFSRSTESRPALLTHNEVTTFLHEFGHALHGMLSQCKYSSLSGTNVSRDFVELPSQIMENWAYEKEWLDSWARHYKTGEKIPEEQLLRIREAMIFNEGHACNRQLSFGMLDMAWHTLKTEFKGDIKEFEDEAMQTTELFKPIDTANMSCAFGHLFAGGYAAGYYGYKWAEVLDADAFSLFKQRGISDKTTAESFRKNILERGGTEEAMDLYKRFRGQEPSLEPLLIRSGFDI